MPPRTYFFGEVEGEGEGECDGLGEGEGVGLATVLARALLDVGRFGAAIPDGLMLAK